MKVRLVDIAHARSGDKGDTANVGVIALRPEWYPLLARELTRDRVDPAPGRQLHVGRDEVRAFGPRGFDGLLEIARAWDTPDRDAVTARVWPTLPKIAIDYAVAEPAAAAGDVWVPYPMHPAPGEACEPAAQRPPDDSGREGERAGAVEVQGPEMLRRAVPAWFTLSSFASVPRPA